MLRNNSFEFRAKFGAIYSASETKESVLKNIPIDNRIWFKNRQTLELLVPRIRNYCNIAVCIIKQKGYEQERNKHFSRVRSVSNRASKTKQ